MSYRPKKHRTMLIASLPLLLLLLLGSVSIQPLKAAVAQPGDRQSSLSSATSALVSALCAGTPTAPTTIGNALAIDVQGNYAYVGDWGDPSGAGMLHVFDVSDPCAPQLIGRAATNAPFGNELGNLSVRNGVAYLANDDNGLARYNVAKQDMPSYIASRRDGLHALSIAYDGGRYAYVGQIYSAGQELAIYDMAAFPTAAPTFYAPSFPGHRDIYNVQVVNKQAYVMASDGSGNNHFQVLDLTTPTAPTLIGDLALPQAQYGGANGELRVQGNYAYLATGTQADHMGGLVVLDISTPAAPQVAGSLFLDDAGSIPLKVSGLAVLGNQVLLMGRSALYTIDVVNPAQPVISGQRAFPAAFGPGLGGHVLIKDNYAYVTVYRDNANSASKGGLTVYALGAVTCAATPAVPTTDGTALGIDVQGSYAYVSDWSGPNGSPAGTLHVFDVSEPCAPQLIGNLATTTPANDVIGDLVVRNGSAYLANSTNGLARYDVAKLLTPTAIDSRQDGTYAHSIAYDGGRYAYVGQIYSADKELAIYDMTTFPAAAPTFYAPSFPGHRDIYNVQVLNKRAYVMASDGSGTNHFQILDLTSPTAPTLIGDLAVPQAQYGGVDGELRVQGNYVYLATSTQADHKGGLVVLDISTPAAPQVAGSLFLDDAGSIPWKGTGLTVSGNQVLLVGRSALYMIDISNPALPAVTAQQDFPAAFGPGLGGRVLVKGNYAYVTVYRDSADSASQGGLAIFNLGAGVCTSTHAVPTTDGTALGIDVQGNYAYVGDWGDPNGSPAGILHVFDVSDPCAPQLIGKAATTAPASNELGDLVVRNGVAYLANDANGLARYDVAKLIIPTYIDQQFDNQTAHVVAYDDGRYAYVGRIYAPGQELAIYDMTTSPVAAPTFYAPSFSGHRDIYSLQVLGKRAYLLAGDGAGNNHFQLLDLTAPTQPALLGDLALPLGQYGNIGDLRVQGSYVYLASGSHSAHNGGLVVIDISVEASPVVAGSAFIADAGDVPWFGASLDLAGDQAYVVTKHGLDTFNIANPAQPTLLTPAPSQAFPAAFGASLGGRVTIKGNLAYVTAYRDPADSASHGGLAIYTINNNVDIGFQSNPNGYAFANYGGVNDSDYTIDDMRRMFGDAAVCVTTTPACQVSAAALTWNKWANETMDGGHCDGMASTSLRFFKGLDNLSSLQTGADTAYDLFLSNARRSIAYNFVEQLTSPVGAYRAQSMQNLPSAILSQLRTAMQGGAADPMTLGVVQAGQGGHAITPYAIEDQGGGLYWVKVYDNNHPNDSSRHVVIDTLNETWSYELAADLTWGGDASTHSLMLTPISLYGAAQACPFCNASSTQASGAPSGQVWLSGPGHLLIRDSQGRRIGYVGGQLVNEVAGAYETTVLSGMGQAREPIYTLPLTETYTIQLGGQTAQSGAAAVAQFGPGYAVAVAGLGVGPATHSQLSFAADGSQASYQSDAASAATLTLAQDGAGASHQFRVSGVDAQAGHVVTMRVDKARGLMAFSGAQAGSAYDLAITRVSAAGAQIFTHASLSIAATDTQYVDYRSWNGSGAITVQIDHGSDGTIDQTVMIVNQYTVYLPLVRR